VERRVEIVEAYVAVTDSDEGRRRKARIWRKGRIRVALSLLDEAVRILSEGCR